MKQYEAKKAIKCGISQSDLDMMSNKSRRCVGHRTQTTRQMISIMEQTEELDIEEPESEEPVV